ncbi:LamB/YcsF family protein [Frigoribacterium sp. CFBP 8754]|uniref:LamB/YcsF family protein n=1 Tax=Frigoribacterium sp. CFBP 8754 TaxID=2775290 RepID=UPI00177EC3C9|nr:5-oxoprolinase subunit PxpA [Frigoribacterium sp. CFBP 8754]MBD8659713.1 LamB/YcsF family protein [Frigoribacterium sp. CFBP 8754]
MTTIDLNADLGEGFGRWTLGDDEALLDVVTSANVACGFHAGDPESLLRVVGQAHRRGVVVGAHVSYRDLAGFGRRYLDASPAELVGDVAYQVGALDGLARAAGTAVRYVKPHGALYTTIARDDDRGAAHADAVVEAVLRVDPALAVVGLAGSAFLRRASAAGLVTVPEAFGDRAYTASGELVPRREPGAVLHDPAEIRDRVLQLVETGRVTSVDGQEVEVDARTVCVHGDSPDAVEVARAVRTGLEEAGVALHSFVTVPGASA